MYGGCVFIPSEHLDELRSWPSKRFVCTLNKQETIYCAIMPNGNGQYFIMVSKQLAKKLRISLGDKVQVSLLEDTSPYGMPMPEEFSQALELDEDGSLFFHKLTIGKQRSLIHLVRVPKSSEIRIRKSLVILEYLRKAGGQLEYKALNEALKASNQ